MTGSSRIPTALALGALLVAPACTEGVPADDGHSPTPTTNSASSATPEDEPSPEPRAPRSQPGGSLVVWARGDLPPSFADRVTALPEIVAAAHVRGATLGLTAVRAADGSVITALDDGFRIPVSVVAVDPDVYAGTLTSEGRAGFAELAPRTVLLTESAAELRGVGVGGRLDIATATDLVVVAVVPDDAAGRSEVIAHVADAARLGLDDDGTLFLRHEARSEAAKERLIEQVERLVPNGLVARVVDVDRADERRRAPLVLSLAQVKQRFGEFAFRPRSGERGVDLAPGFVQEHITTTSVPLLGPVTCHRLIIDDLRAALNAVAEAGLADEIEPDRYAGCFNARRISATSDRLSHHAWGIALDINVDLSAPGGGEIPHPGVIEAFETNGFRWGGDFLQPDNHHFEWVGEPDV